MCALRDFASQNITFSQRLVLFTSTTLESMRVPVYTCAIVEYGVEVED